MPFKSKSQWKACFVTKGFGGKVDCKKWAKKTKKYKKLPKKVKSESFKLWLNQRDESF